MRKYILENRHLFIISLINFIIIYTSTFIKGYGYFIDEFYYIACANNPAGGYVDHPPLAPLILTFYKFVFGESLYAIRFLPAFSASVTVFLTGIITRDMGGSRTAQAIASFSIMMSPVFATFSGFFSMNAFEPMLTAIVLYYLVKMLRKDNPVYWIHIGIVFGLLILNKHTAGIFITFLLISLLITPQRKYLFSRYFLYSIIISIFLFLPNIIWQVLNNFPTLEFYTANIQLKNVKMPVTEYLLLLLFGYNPYFIIVAFTGAIILLSGKVTKQYRYIGIMFLFIFISFLINRTGRIDRIAFAFIGVIPAGAIYINQLITKIKQKWIYYAGMVLMILNYALMIPVLLPYLNYENSAKLTNFLGLNTEIEAGKKPIIPQLLADRIGWEEKADMVGRVYLSLTEEERRRSIIAADNYGNAGALEFYGKKYGFRYVVSGHNNYFLWSKERLDGDIVLQLTNKNSYKGLKEAFGTVDSTDVLFDNEYCSPHERNLTVFICRNAKHSNIELLEGGKHYY